MERRSIIDIQTDRHIQRQREIEKERDREREQCNEPNWSHFKCCRRMRFIDRKSDCALFPCTAVCIY